LAAGLCPDPTQELTVLPHNAELVLLVGARAPREGQRPRGGKGMDLRESSAKNLE